MYITRQPIKRLVGFAAIIGLTLVYGPKREEHNNIIALR